MTHSPDRFAFASVLAFLILIPASAGWSPSQWSGHDYARIAQLSLLLVCAASSAVATLRSRWPRADRATAGCCAAVLLLALAGTLHGPVRAMAWREFCVFLGLVATAMAVARSIAGRETAAQRAVAVSAALHAVLALMTLGALLLASSPIHRLDLVGGYDNGRFFNHVQTVMLPLAALCALREHQQRVFRWLAVFGLVFGIALVVFYSGRSTAIALLVATATAACLFQETLLPLWRKALTLAFAVAAVYAVFFILLPHLCGSVVLSLRAEGVSDTGSAHTRFYLWNLALADIAESPWLGIGPMHFAHRGNIEAAHPHNVYLQIAAEWGLPMLALVVALAATGLWKLARAVRRCTDPRQALVGACLFVACMAIPIDGIFSGNFVMPVPQVWIAVVIGWAVAWARCQPPAPDTASAKHLPRPAAIAFAMALLASQVWLCVTAWPEARDLSRHLQATSHNPQQGWARNARFWSDGWF